MFLMVSTRGRFLVLGGNPLHGSDALDSRMGACLWDLSLGQLTGDGKYDGETFLGRTWMFFSGRGGGGKRDSRARAVETFSQDDASSKQPWVYVIYYMLSSGGFAAACLQAITKGVLDPRVPWADTVAVRLRQSVDLVHALKTVKVLLLLGPSRTPRSSGYDVYAHAVYVVICYMSVVVVRLFIGTQNRLVALHSALILGSRRGGQQPAQCNLSIH